MTLQEVYNTVKAHLLSQGRKSFGLLPPEGHRLGSQDEAVSCCLYRGPEGLKCAAGPLIPDALYSPSMENMPIERLMYAVPALAVHIGRKNERLVRELQFIHDRREPSEWPNRLNACAVKHGLTP